MAASTEPALPDKPRRRYFVATVVLIGAGFALSYLPSGVTFKPIEGVTIFAILYVLAQAIERVNQILVPIFDRLVGLGSTTASHNKEAGILKVRKQRAALQVATSGAVTDEIAAASDDGEKAVTAANIEKALLTNGLAFALAMATIALFKFTLLDKIGFAGLPPLIDTVVTATAIMGGAAGLGELIAKIQKQKAEAETK